jgi:uncharacterized protein YndB with AHSA1/START domain
LKNNALIVRTFGAAAVGGGVAVAIVAGASNPPAAYRLALDLAHPPETVWAALTQKARIDRYYLAPIWSDVGCAGSEMVYGPPGARLIEGAVLEADAPRRLRHTFRFAGADAGPYTTVTYRLEPTATGTRLEIHHAGYPRDSQGHADISGGWPVIAEKLKVYLDGAR